MKKSVIVLSIGLFLFSCGAEEKEANKQKSLEEMEQEEVCKCSDYADRLFASDDFEKFAEDNKEEHQKCAALEEKFKAEKLSAMRENCK